MRTVLFLLTSLCLGVASASTFVGNGGNAGDVELQVTLNQIEKTLAIVSQQNTLSGNALCVCDEGFEGRSWCEMLQKLSAQQRRFCEKTIYQNSSKLTEMLRQNGSIRFSWTHEPIEVREHGVLRAVDAVTDPQKMTMTLNQPRYLELSDIDRVFLLSHEMFHLTSLEGKPLSDEGEVGPFKGSDGGRQLINAMAAALVMQTSKADLFQEYKSAVRRSKSYKKSWLTLGYSTVSTENDTTTAYDIMDHKGLRLGYRYQLTEGFGLVGEFSSMRGEKTILDTISLTEDRQTLSLGASYRLFPFENPLTFSGQSHFLFAGTLDFVNGTYKVEEAPTTIEDKFVTTSYTLSCNYFIPFAGGLWGYGGVGYSGARYKYDKVNLSYKNSGATFNLGVSYGF